MPNTIDTPKVSIIIPVYNGANYVREAIDSALAQTYPNLEIIVINDGSDDKGATDRIIKSYKNRVQYISKPNGGVASALNSGINAMTGKYLSWLSHDDIYYPEKIEKQVKDILTLPTNAILYSNYNLIDEKSHTLSTVKHDHKLLIEKPLYGILRGCIHGCSLLIPREAFEKCGTFNEDLKTTQDYDLWFKMFRHYNFIHREDILIKSRWHAEQGSKVSPVMITEGNSLWINMLENLSESEILKCERTTYSFYFKMKHFLGTTPFTKAISYCEKKIEKENKRTELEISSIKVSVILVFRDKVTKVCEAIKSVLNQNHDNFEILLIDIGCQENLSPLLEVVKDYPHLNYSNSTGTSTALAKNHAIEMAHGDYVAFLNPNDQWYPEKLKEQLLFMIRHGCETSHTAYNKFDEENKILPPSLDENGGNKFPHLISNCTIALSTLMLKNNISKQYKFPEGYSCGEDICFLIAITHDYKLAQIPMLLANIKAPNGTDESHSNHYLRSLVDILQFSASRYKSSEISNDFKELACTIADIANSRPVKITYNVPHSRVLEFFKRYGIDIKLLYLELKSLLFRLIKKTLLVLNIYKPVKRIRYSILKVKQNNIQEKA